MARPRIRPDMGGLNLTRKPGDSLTGSELALIEQCSAFGFTSKAIADLLGMTEDSMTKYKDRFPHVKQAFEQGNARIHNKLLSLMMDFVNNPDIPYEAKRKDIHFILTRKFGWKEQVTVSNDKPHLPGVPVFEEVTTIDMEPR